MGTSGTELLQRTPRSVPSVARHWHDRWVIRRRDGDTRSVSSVHDAQFFEATNHAEKEQCSPESSTRESWSDAERGAIDRPSGMLSIG